MSSERDQLVSMLLEHVATDDYLSLKDGKVWRFDVRRPTEKAGQ